jgi:hypothetical protein
MTTAETNHRSTSDVLLGVVREHPGERMSIQNVINGLAERSFGFLLLLFGIASAVAPPGVATLTAIPLLFFGLQMLAGYPTPWLPKSIAGRDFNKADLEKTIQRGIPIMRFVERLCRPRFEFLIGPVGERLLGLLIFILAVVVAAPGPLTNAPPGIAISFISIAIINRDGLLVLFGVLASVVALYLGGLGLYLVVTDVIPWLWEHAKEFWHRMF